MGKERLKKFLSDSNVPRSLPLRGIPSTQEQLTKLLFRKRKRNKLTRIRQIRGQTLAGVEGSLSDLSKISKQGMNKRQEE